MRDAEMIAPRLMLAFADLSREASFVEIGANDGVLFDPLRPYIERYRWRGVLVEPIPHIFAQLEQRYRDHPRIELERAAVADRDGRRTMFFAVEERLAGGPAWAGQVASFDRAHVAAELGVEPGDEAIAETEVECLSFETLLRRHPIERLDLLLIDAEGADAEILSAVDLGRHRPRLVVYEHQHLGADEGHACEERLVTAGYELVADGLDTWALDLGPDDELSRRWRAAIAERGA